MADDDRSPWQLPQPCFTWQLPRRTLSLGRVPLFMGIVNVTPDSFSDGGRYTTVDAAVEQARGLVEQGADILDIGGESTRPGAEPVPLDEELRRVIPVIERLAKEFTVPLSIDTTKAEVARQALAAGAEIVNDISGLAFDPEMPAVCRDAQAAVICMHIQGTPQTMQIDPRYPNDDPVTEIRRILETRLRELEEAGIPGERIVLDPGIGFGKTAAHNLQLLANVARFRELGRPLCIGHSRKRFLARILQRPVDERTFATVGISLALALQTCDIIRLHDIAPSRDCLLAFAAVMEQCPEWRHALAGIDPMRGQSL